MGTAPNACKLGYSLIPACKQCLWLLLVVLCTSCITHGPVCAPAAPAPHSQAVVFDIDGTLTPSPLSIYRVRQDAVHAVRRYAEEGIHIVYLSARIQMFQGMIPNWLQREGFPVGSLHLPNTGKESHDPAGFKASILKQYHEHGWHFVAAYGDSTTDFEAYSQAGIEQRRVFALLRSAEDACQKGAWSQCYTGWSEHLGDIHQILLDNRR